ncbi:putative cytosolic sulfotransferase 12-like [Capsicum annuum]|nr:putative cytosolic sulfotransferase 12-like [Capsicum annuum]
MIPDFIKYLQQENAYAQYFMKDTEEGQKVLFAEIISRMPNKISTPPELWGPWLYYQYIPEGKEFPVLCRKLAAESKGWMKTLSSYVIGVSKEEQVLLDWNEIAERYGYVHVGTCRVSPDHNYLAYTIDVTGSEQFVLQIKDLRNDCVLPTLGVEGVVSVEWAQDSYSVHNVPLFVENDSGFCVDIASTKDGKFITVYVINATNLQTGIQRFCKRVSGVQYFLEHHHGFFYVLTNSRNVGEESSPSSGEYYLARCPVENLQSTFLQNIIEPSREIFIQDMDMFDEHLVLFLNKEGSSLICSVDMRTIINCEEQMKIDELSPWFFPLPSDMCAIAPGSNHDFTRSVYRAVVSSPVCFPFEIQMPDAIVDYDMSRRTFSVIQQEEVINISHKTKYHSNNGERSRNELLGTTSKKEDNIQNNEVQRWSDFAEIYSCQEKEVISHDGERIPITILFSHKAHKKGQSPGLLHGYGAYGEMLDKSWCSDRLSLLDRGWVIAFADVRGGGGPDPSWHKYGSGMSKLNSISDFVSCGKYLLSEGFVHERRLGAVGVSAGSLLVAAAINMYPELFQAAILKVPFLDVCNSLLDSNLPLTVLDYEEFGNPQLQAHFDYILKYSPYDNIPEGLCCPPMLVKASLNDSRVGVWEAAKWVAKIRDKTCTQCSSSVILQTNMSGGHFGEGGRFGQCEEAAYEYAFLMKVLGES